MRDEMTRWQEKTITNNQQEKKRSLLEERNCN